MNFLTTICVVNWREPAFRWRWAQGLSNIAFIPIDMWRPEIRAANFESWDVPFYFVHFALTHLWTGKHPQGITKHWPQTPIGKSARLEAIQHLEKRADFHGQTIQQHPFLSLSTSNTNSSVHPLFVLMLPLKTIRKKSVYRTYRLARSLQA